MKEIMKLYPELANASLNGEKAFDFDPITGLYSMGSWVEQYANEQALTDIINASIADTMATIGLAYANIEAKKRQHDKEIANSLYNGDTIYPSYSGTYDMEKGYEVGSVTIGG